MRILALLSGTLLAVHPDALLVLAPRHPDRAGQIRDLLVAMGLTVACRSTGESPRAQVYLADTLGEMGLWFDLCPVAFIGGSLVPVGGHNGYEPALQGAAILHGPEVANFADLYTRLDQSGGALGVTATTLAPTLDRLMRDEAARHAMAQAARATIAAEADATDRTAALILSALSASAP